MTPDKDPGWKPALKRGPRYLIPFAWLGSRPRRPYDLLALRELHVAMVCSLLLLLIAFSFIAGAGRKLLVWGWLVLIASAALALYRIWKWERRLELATDEMMAARRYALAYFVRLGMAMTPSLASFALFILVGGGPEVYLLGVTISEVLLWRIAPSRSNLARLTSRYHALGKNIDMTRALIMQGPPRDAWE